MTRTCYLLLFFLLLSFAAPGLTRAAVVGSQHDLSALGGAPCSYCHSVHNAAGGLGRPAYMGPLPVISKVYSNATLDTVLNLADVNNSDAPICLSCHDGAFVASMTDATVSADLTAALTANPALDIGVDLSDDHPVGFVYDPSVDPQIHLPIDPKVHVTFGPGRNEMWCSTCHNVHDPTYPPFLAISNAQSALCLTCHDK